MKNFPGYGLHGKCRSCAPFLVAYLEQQLDANRRARVEAHLAICPACQAELAAVNAMSHVLRGHRAAPARIETDLWSRIEADLQKLPHRAPNVQQTSRPSSDLRSPFLGGASWGQALPLAASVFAAGVLVTALIDASHHRVASATVAARTTPPIVAPQRLVSPSQTPAGVIATSAATPIRQAAVSSVAAAAVTHSRRDRGIASTTVANDRRHSVREPHTEKQIAQRSFGWHSTRSLESSSLPSPLYNAGKNPQRVAMLSTTHVAADRAEQVAALSDRYMGALNVGPLAASATAASPEPRDSFNLNSDSAASGVKHPSDEKNLASRGAYAVDDESSVNVSVADISGSVRRQQGLFSYTQQ